jgi:hypothetical protein
MPANARKVGLETTIERHDKHTHFRSTDGRNTYCSTFWDDGRAESHMHPNTEEPSRISPTHRYVMRSGVLFCLIHDGMCEAPGEATH